MMYQFGWFSTGKGKGSRDLLTAAHDSIQRGETKARLAFVFCSRQPGESAESDLFLELVRNYQIPLVYYSFQKFKAGKAGSRQGEALPQWRLEYDRQVMDKLAAFQPDLSILAGYMLIVGREMCARLDMINLHPAAPGGPTGTWQEVVWQLIKSRARQTGVMLHLVTPELDRGPVVSYCTFAITGDPFDKYRRQINGQDVDRIKAEQGENNPLFKLIREHGFERECPLILATMKAFSQGAVKIVNGMVAGRDGKPLTGYNLTDEIDKLVRKKLQP